jgi:hypothetical protein
MGRPRNPETPTTTEICPTHGATDFRQWKKGRDKAGGQRYVWKCALCHAAYNLANYHAQKGA